LLGTISPDEAHVAKVLSKNVLKGQIGINVVERAVLQMGHKWVPGSGNLDTGIDGEIELCDPVTREAKNVIIRVQVRGRSALESDSPNGFIYTCSAADLEHWLYGNAPVVLVVVDLITGEAWWISVRDHFQDPMRRKTRKATFDKKADRLDCDAGERLQVLGQRSGGGIYFAPRRRTESLISNLLQVTRVPSRLFMAETKHRDPKELSEELKRVAGDRRPAGEWMLRDGSLYSVHNLRDAPWTSVCELGTVEQIDTEEWADSESLGVRVGFVRLLNQCLRSCLGRHRLWRQPDEDCYYFAPTDDLAPRTVRYRSLKQWTSRVVFQGYMSKKDPTRLSYYRHVGFESSFMRFSGSWYLQINPRYVFTVDGKGLHQFREELQATIKTYEGSGAVRGSVVMFAALLQDDPSLFQVRYPHLGFGELLTTSLGVGIEDDLWLHRDELQPLTARNTDSLLFAE
jgi:hypothetical protein